MPELRTTAPQADLRTIAWFNSANASHDEARDAVACLSLPESVPAEVGQYFDALRSLWLQGWYCFDFYGWVDLHARICVEKALRQRLRRHAAEPKGRPGLRQLLDAAVAKGYLPLERYRPRKSPWGKWLELLLFRHTLAADIDDLERDVRDFCGETPPTTPVVSFMNDMARVFAAERNTRAHGHDATGSPWQAACALELAHAVIVQLFPEKGRGGAA